MQTDLTYHEKLGLIAKWYLDHVAPEGGWPMQWAEAARPTKSPSILSTAYGLALLRHAGVASNDSAVQAGLRFILTRPSTGWEDTRHALYTILGLSEWPEMIALGTPNGGLGVQPTETQAKVADAVEWLADATDEGSWSPSPGGHPCIAWTAKVVYGLGRLRMRTARYRADQKITALLNAGVEVLVASQSVGPGDSSGSWAVCGGGDASVANTALATIALSHRFVESASQPQRADAWRAAYLRGRDWLLQNHDLWEANESGEDDPVAHDSWQFATFSLAPRACLSAGAPPEHPHLARCLNFAFNRWRRGVVPGWAIYGKGVTGYSTWSVVQLAQVLRLSISRQDPMRILRALQQGPTRVNENAELALFLEGSSRTVSIRREGDAMRTLRMATQERRFLLLQAFAHREVAPGGALSIETLTQFVGGRSSNASPQRKWNALKALAHETNEVVRAAVEDRAVQVFRTTTKPEPSLVLLARCVLQESTGHVMDEFPPDIDGLDQAVVMPPSSADDEHPHARSGGSGVVS
jgi:hypothetical protein